MLSSGIISYVVLQKEYGDSRDGIMAQFTTQKELLCSIINDIVGVPINSQHVTVSSDQCPLGRQVRFSELVSERT